MAHLIGLGAGALCSCVRPTPFSSPRIGPSGAACIVWAGTGTLWRRTARPRTGTPTPAQGGDRLHRPAGTSCRTPTPMHLSVGRGTRLIRRGRRGVLRRGAAREAAHPHHRGGERRSACAPAARTASTIKDAFIPAHQRCRCRASYPRRRHARRHAGNGAPRQSDVLGRVAALPHVAITRSSAPRRRRRRIPGSSFRTERPTSAVVPRAEHEDFQRALGQATILADAAENPMVPAARLHGNVRALGERRALITVEQNLRYGRCCSRPAAWPATRSSSLFKNAGTSVARKAAAWSGYLRDAQMYRVDPSSLFEASGRWSAARVLDCRSGISTSSAHCVRVD